MADLTDLTQTATTSDRVMPSWFNAVRNKLDELTSNLALANQTINQLRSETAQAFQVTVASGLSLNYEGGQIKLLDGTVKTISPGAISVPNNATSFLFLNSNGDIQVNTQRPDIGFEIAKITTASNAVTALVNYPSFTIRSAPVDLSAYATVDYVLNQKWVEVGSARKTALFNIPSTATYHTIPFEALTGNGFNTSGVFTPTASGKYLFNPRIRVDSLSPNNPLAVKLSLFVNGVEYLLHQSDSAYGDLSASMMSQNFDLTPQDNVTMKVYLTRGTSARVREGSTIVVYKI